MRPTAWCRPEIAILDVPPAEHGIFYTIDEARDASDLHSPSFFGTIIPNLLDVQPPSPSNKEYLENAVAITIRIALMVLVVGLCALILKPFLSILAWSVIFAVALYPVFKRIRKFLGGRDRLTAVLLILILLILFILPSVLLTDTLVADLRKCKADIQSGNLKIPPPGDRVNSWPAIAKPVVDFWSMASSSLTEVMQKYMPQIKEAGTWLLGEIKGLAVGILQLMIAVVIAGVWLVHAKVGRETATKAFVQLAPTHGEKFLRMSEVTIRKVVEGIFGVAIIQTMMAALGFFIAGVPSAGLLTVLCLILCVVQLGPSLLVIPVAIYMFSVSSTLVASLFAVWMLITILSDNILKPILLGRGAPVPMLVIFLGSIGGFISMGFIGLFLGSIGLSVGYKLYHLWLGEDFE